MLRQQVFVLRSTVGSDIVVIVLKCSAFDTYNFSLHCVIEVVG